MNVWHLEDSLATTEVSLLVYTLVHISTSSSASFPPWKYEALGNTSRLRKNISIFLGHEGEPELKPKSHFGEAMSRTFWDVNGKVFWENSGGLQDTEK